MKNSLFRSPWYSYWRIQKSNGIFDNCSIPCPACSLLPFPLLRILLLHYHIPYIRLRRREYIHRVYPAQLERRCWDIWEIKWSGGRRETWGRRKMKWREVWNISSVQGSYPPAAFLGSCICPINGKERGGYWWVDAFIFSAPSASTPLLTTLILIPIANLPLPPTST